MLTEHTPPKWHEEYAPRSVGLLDWAYKVAFRAHDGQVRKYTGEPYIVHPMNVARIVAETFPDVDTICAAYLHDVIEDCDVGLKDLLRAGFGGRVVRMVSGLTDVSRPEDGNRAERKAIDREHTAAQDALTKTIKLADLLDNTCSIVRHDPKFAKVYLHEKALLLGVLREGDLFLRTSAEEQLDRAIVEVYGYDS